MKRNIFVVLFMIICLYSCSNKSNPNGSISKIEKIEPLKLDTLSIETFTNVFYKLLSKIYVNQPIELSFYGNNMNYLINGDTLIIKSEFPSPFYNFFQYHKNDKKRLLLFGIIKSKENILVLIKRVLRNKINDATLYSSLKTVNETDMKLLYYKSSDSDSKSTKNSKKSLSILILKKSDKKIILFSN